LILEEDEYIGEEASAIYDNSLRVIMLQRNIASLSSVGVEEYINLIWKEKNGLKLFLRPIPRHITIDELESNSISFKKLTMRYADTANTSITSFNNALEELSKFEPNILEIVVSVGRKRKKYLNKVALLSFLKDILKKKDNVDKLSLTIFKNNESTEILDLLSDMTMHDFISYKIPKRQSVGFEYMEQRMKEVFDERKRMIAQTLIGVLKK